MKTIKLDDSGNILLHNGTFVILTDLDALIQRVENKFLMYRGEYHLNTDAGSPWFQDIMKRPADIAAVESMVRRTITSVEGVIKVPFLSINHDDVTRTTFIEFKAETVFGLASSGVQL